MQNACSEQQISSSIRHGESAFDMVSLCAYSSTFGLMKIHWCFLKTHLATMQLFKPSGPSFTVILVAASADLSVSSWLLL